MSLTFRTYPPSTHSRSASSHIAYSFALAVAEALDSNHVLLENANVETENFALLFEFDGDVKKIRHVLYHCSAARPNIESQTNEDEIEVQTETLSLSASPLSCGYVKARTGDDTTDTVYTAWYEEVYMPTEPVTAPLLAPMSAGTTSGTSGKSNTKEATS